MVMEKYIVTVNHDGVIQNSKKLSMSPLKQPIIKVEVTTNENDMFVEIPQQTEKDEDYEPELPESASPCPQASAKRRKDVNFDAIKDLILKPARIIFNRRKQRYILRCVRLDGKSRERYFVNMTGLENFVRNIAEIRDWLTVEHADILTPESLIASRNMRDKKWKFRQPIEAGTETIKFVDSLFDFNITKKYKMHQRWKPYVKITRHPSVPEKSVHSSIWGETHRMDDIYEPLNPPDSVMKSGYPVCVWTIGCSSKSDKCTSDCGKPLSECSVVDDKFTCCNEHVPFSRQCYNCSATTSAYGSWHRLDGKNACKICFNYHRRRGKNRPFKPEHANKKYYEHFKCNFQLKLELQSDFKTYFVYDLKSNELQHYTAKGIGTRRFKQSERDAVDILRTARLNPFQILKRNQTNVEQNRKLRLRQYQNRCRRISKKVKPEEMEIETSIVSDHEHNIPVLTSDTIATTVSITQEQSEQQSNVTETHSNNEDVIQNLVINEDGAQDDAVVEETNIAVVTSETVIEDDVKNSIACLKCVFEQRDEVFSCLSELELEKHLITSHNENTMCCVNCLEEGVVHSFSSSSELRKHVEESHHHEQPPNGTNNENISFEETTS